MLVKNIPPVPEGFDPDSVQFGVPPTTRICRLSTGSDIPQWFKPIESIWSANHIFCLPLKPWYPASWYDSNGNLLPDVYEHDPKKWPEHVGPLDEVGLLFAIERRDKTYSDYIYTAGRSGYWDKVVAYRIAKRNSNN